MLVAWLVRPFPSDEKLLNLREHSVTKVSLLAQEKHSRATARYEKAFGHHCRLAVPPHRPAVFFAGLLEGDFFLAAAHLARIAAAIFFLAAGLSLRALGGRVGLRLGFFDGMIRSVEVRRARTLFNLAISLSIASSIKAVFMHYSILRSLIERLKCHTMSTSHMEDSLGEYSANARRLANAYVMSGFAAFCILKDLTDCSLELATALVAQ